MPRKVIVEQFRKGDLIKTVEEPLAEGQMWLEKRRLIIEASEGNNDRFILTDKRTDEHGEVTYENTISMCVYHLSDRVLIYMLVNDSPRLWEYYADKIILIDKLKQVEEGLVIGVPIDDYMIHVPVECKDTGIIQDFRIVDRNPLKLELLSEQGEQHGN